jgi:hypothetical protein
MFPTLPQLPSSAVQAIEWDVCTGSLAAYKRAIQIAREDREAIRAARLKVARRAAKQTKAEASMQNGHATQDSEAASQVSHHLPAS